MRSRCLRRGIRQRSDQKRARVSVTAQRAEEDQRTAAAKRSEPEEEAAVTAADSTYGLGNTGEDEDNTQEEGESLGRWTRQLARWLASWSDQAGDYRGVYRESAVGSILLSNFEVADRVFGASLLS